MALRIQKPTDGYDWLYQDREENDRYFTTFVYLGKSEPAWEECTTAEKEQWESLNPQPEPTEEADLNE